MKTIAQQLNIKEFPFEIRDSKGKIIYYENSNESWWKREFDSECNIIYYEHSDGYWWKCEYDSNGNEIYYENSDGEIIDKRLKPVKEMTVEQISKELGYEIKIVK